MRFVLLCFVGAGLLGACATNSATVSSNAAAPAPEAAETAATEENVQETAEVDEDRVICKRIIATGSRFKKNVCRTWAEWKQIEDQSQQNTGALQRSMRGQVSGN